MGHENKTVKRYRRKLLNLQKENDYLNRLVDVQNMRLSMLSNKLEEALTPVPEIKEETDNGQD